MVLGEKFLNETIDLLRKLTDKPLLVRLDLGNYFIDNVAVLMEIECYFIIERNLRKENIENWFQTAKVSCNDIV